MIPMLRSSADLFAELNHMQSLLDHFLPARTSSIRSVAGAAFPALNIGTTPTAIELQALVPGIDPAAIQITLDRGLLTIAGERKSDVPDDENTHVYARERFGGSFRRVVSLPEDADPAQVDASYRDGILRITVKKREASQPRRIEIN
jgi:HSP20 family protein